MALTAFTERRDSRRSTANPPTYETRWNAIGETGSETVKAYTLVATPGIVVTPQGILYRQDVQVEPTQANDLYYVTVPYAARKQVVGSYRLSFDTTGGTVHITNSKESITRYYSGGSEAGGAAATNVPKYEGAIGVDASTGEVAGTDVIIPALKLSVAFKHPQAVVSLSYIKNLSRWTALVNSDTFLTFAPGEVLFLGATGSEGTDAETEIQYQFACSQNATGLTIGGIANVAKKGHEVAWIRYEEEVSAGYAIKKPKFIYVERVYDTLAFVTAFGFGS